jgi:hypothetical protein
MKLSPCARFVLLDGLYLDREAASSLAGWASRRGLALQDAIQLAVVAFVDAGDMAHAGKEGDRTAPLDERCGAGPTISGPLRGTGGRARGQASSRS